MSPEESRQDVHAEIRAVIDRRAQAFRAADARGVLATYSAEAVTFDLPPPLQLRGTDEPGLWRWFATWTPPIAREQRDLTITAAEDVAFVHSLVHISGRRGSTDEDLWLRETLGLRRIHGRWTITHEHTSVPFHMDGSDRAALDLTP